MNLDNYLFGFVDVAGLTVLRFIDFGSVLYGQNDQYYRIGLLGEDFSTMVLFISSHAHANNFGICSICKNYKGGYLKSVVGSVTVNIYADSSGVVFVKVPSGELVSMTALGNSQNLINVGYGVSLPSDAVLL